MFGVALSTTLVTDKSAWASGIGVLVSELLPGVGSGAGLEIVAVLA